MIGIIGAMNSEVTTLCNNLEKVEQLEIQNLKFFKGILKGKEVVVVQSGIGKVNAALCAQLLAIIFKVEKIINTGIAGALGEGLRICDFAVSTGAVYHDVDLIGFGYKLGEIPGQPIEYTADEDLLALAENAFGKISASKEHKLVKGRIASGDQFISSPEKKNYIKQNFSPVCVEMEGTAIAHACYLNNVPFLIVRCMSDMADEQDEKVSVFNENIAADLSAEFVMKIIELL